MKDCVQWLRELRELEESGQLDHVQSTPIASTSTGQNDQEYILRLEEHIRRMQEPPQSKEEEETVEDSSSESEDEGTQQTEEQEEEDDLLSLYTQETNLDF